MGIILAKLRMVARGAWAWLVLVVAAVALFYLAYNLGTANAFAFMAAGVVFGALVTLFLMARQPPRVEAPAGPAPVSTTLLTPTVLVNEIRAAALVSYGQIGTVTVKKERNRAKGEMSAALLNPFVGEELVMDVGVRVVAGVNLKHLREDDVRIDGGAVEITLPPTKVLMVYVDESLTRVVWHKKGWLSAHDIGMMDSARRDAMESMVNAAIEKGLLDKAGDHAAVAIGAIARSLGFSDVKVFTALPPMGAHFEELQDPEAVAKVMHLPLNPAPREDQHDDA